MFTCEVLTSRKLKGKLCFLTEGDETEVMEKSGLGGAALTTRRPGSSSDRSGGLLIKDDTKSWTQEAAEGGSQAVSCGREIAPAEENEAAHPLTALYLSPLYVNRRGSLGAAH